MAVTVQDITRATPTILRILVIDEDFVKYPLVKLATVDPSHPTDSWVSRTNPYTGALENCRVLGDGTWLRFEPTEPTNFLDRAAADVYTNYPDLGSASPIAVYRKSYAHHQREASGGTFGVNMINCRHELFLKYNALIPDGLFTMSVTGGFIPDTDFTVSDGIRSDTIRATQIGHKPTDPEKVAKMAVWIPGNGTHGQMDLSLAGENFYIINEAGTTVHTGTISLHMSPTDKERSGATDYTQYPSTTGVVRCTSVTVGSPTQFNVPGHGFTNGTEKFFSGFSGLGTALQEGSWQTITVIDTNNISVAVDTTGLTHTVGAYVTDYDSQIHDLCEANRANTYVYNLDYSAFQPTAGNYGKHRVYVPGYGVSWPFEVDPAARYVALRNSIKGYMSQCWGMPLSWAQANWNRPGQFRDGFNGQKVYESTKPGCWDEEGGYFNTISDNGMDAKWRTSIRVTDWFGAFSDAGDWDFHLVRHCQGLYALLDVAYEYVPSGERNNDYGFPKSSQTIDRNLYSAIDNLGDVVHMVIWYLEPFRRSQHADGWVYSGCQYTDGAEDDHKNPSWISDNAMYLLAADHVATMYYAWVAAKLARILNDAGATSLGATWLQSAEDAYTWADAIWSDWDTDGISSTGAWKNWYIDTLDCQTTGGYSNADVTSSMNAMNNLVNDKSTQTIGIRINAATTLWRANGGIDDAYNTVIKAATGGFFQLGLTNFGAREYIQGPDLLDNTTVRNAIDVETEANTYSTSSLANGFTYKCMPRYDVWTDCVQTSHPLAFIFWPWYDQVTGYGKYIDGICGSEDYVGGVNQLGMCFTTGIGHNPPDPILVRDQEWANIDPTPGYTIYVRGGPVGMAEQQYNSTHMTKRPTTTSIEKQSQWPLWDAYPICEQHVRNSFSIYSTEFVTDQQIIGRICHLIWLHTWDETGTTELVDAPKPGVLSL